MGIVGSSVAVSHALTTGPLLTAQGLRYAAAAALLVGIARWRHVPVVRPRGAEWLWLSGVALTGLVLFNIAVVRGVEHAEPAVIAVAISCAPVLLAVLGPLLEGRAPRPRALSGAVVVVAGSVLVVGAGDTDLIGLAWAVVALVCEAAFTLLALPVLARHTAWGVSVHAVWMAAVGLLLTGAVLEGPTAMAELSVTQLAALLYLTVLVTAVAFVLWYGAVGSLGSGRAALLCGVAPVAAALVGIATTGHAPALPVWGGIALVLGGLAVGFGKDEAPAGSATPGSGT